MRVPVFSIIIPCHNEQEHILKTIKSIEAQTFSDFEILIILDKSTDKSLDIIEYHKNRSPFPIKTFIVNKGSAAGARNEGIKWAKGKYILFQDADCYASPTLLNNALKYFEEINIDGIATRTTNTPPKNWIQHAVATQRACRWENQYDSPAIKFLDYTSGINVAIMKTSVVRELGGFNEKIFYFEDNDLTQRFFFQGYKAVFGKDVIQYHNDPASLTESLGQCKNIAKGLRLRIKNGDGLTIFEWISLFSGIITPINLITFIAIWATSYDVTKDFKGSIYSAILWELRSLAKLFYFLVV
jgi:glycosyltransferase involved in cell wall biosynthesis